MMEIEFLKLKPGETFLIDEEIKERHQSS